MTGISKLLLAAVGVLLTMVIWLLFTRPSPDEGRSLTEERIACYQGGGDWEQHGAVVVGCSHD